MQDIANDMDDLFRKAAEAYPLKPGEDRWEEIFRRVDPAVPAPQKNNHTVIKSLPLLLAFIAAFLFLNDNSLDDFSKGSTASHSAVIDAETLSSSATQDKTYLTPTKASSTVFTRPAQSGIFIGSKTAHTALLLDGITSQIDYGSIHQNFSPANTGSGLSEFPTPTIFLDTVTAVSSSAKQSLQDTSDASKEMTEDAAPSNPGVIKKKAALKGWYYGVTAGVGASSVKDQSQHGTGYNAGVLAGYSFNEKLSMETGLFFSAKKYRSAGEYFNKQAMHTMMPDVTEIKTINGSTKLVELQVRLKYNVINHPKNAWYVAPGLSSFLVTNESNKYQVMMNGSEEKMTGDYNKDHVYCPAAIDLGIGYTRKLGQQMSINIEPYIQLPVKGMGVGKMPVKTVGIQVSLTGRLK